MSLQVRRQDQDMINEFGKLNARKAEAREEITEAKKRTEELDDAEEGVMLADDSEEGTVKCVQTIQYASSDVKYTPQPSGSEFTCTRRHYNKSYCRVMIGECFVDVDSDHANNFISERREVGRRSWTMPRSYKHLMTASLTSDRINTYSYWTPPFPCRRRLPHYRNLRKNLRKLTSDKRS